MVRTPVLIPSPDGRHAVRKDVTRVAFDDVAILGTAPQPRGRFGRAKTTPLAVERRYGLTYQVWELDPLRFVGRLVVAWLSVEDMPDSMGYFRGLDRGQALAQRQAYWDAIAGTLLEQGGGPEDDLPPSTAYPAWFQADDRLFSAAMADLDSLAERWADFAAWQPDGAAFWVRTNGFFTCVGLDGSGSPRLWLERKGLMADSWVPCAQYSHHFEALPGRQGRETFDDGAAILDGSPSLEVMQRAVIPIGQDGWVPAAATTPDSVETGEAAAGATSGQRTNRITVAVPSWTVAGITEAVDELAAEMTADLAGRAEDDTIELRFAVEGALLPEDEFFDRVGLEHPDALPSLGRLVEAATDAMSRSTFLYSDSARGVGLLSRAVRWLGVLDTRTLPTVMGYGRVVDAEHEHTFVGETVPGIVRVHGWTDETIDFAFWVLIRNFLNGLQDFDEVWSGWHLHGAVLQRDPVALARRVVELNREAITTGRYQVQGRPGGLEQLARDIATPHEPWAVAFFAAAQDELTREQRPELRSRRRVDLGLVTGAERRDGARWREHVRDPTRGTAAARAVASGGPRRHCVLDDDRGEVVLDDERAGRQVSPARLVQPAPVRAAHDPLSVELTIELLGAEQFLTRSRRPPRHGRRCSQGGDTGRTVGVRPRARPPRRGRRAP